MKVVFVANTDWYLYHFRLNLARALCAEGYTLLLVSPPGSFSDRLIREGFHWIPWQVSRKGTTPIAEANAFWQLLGLYRKEHPDIVHHFTIKPVLYGSIAARIAGIHSVVDSITGRGYLFLQDSLKVRLLRESAKIIYRYALNRPGTIVTFENPDDLDYFKTAGLMTSGESTIIEGAGVDPDEFTPLEEPAGPVTIVLPARLLWDKGVGMFVEAVRLLKRDYSFRAVLVGNLDPGNPAAIDVETVHGWEAQGIIEWWGFQEDMVSVLRSAHIVVLPSMGEGLPTTLIEAAACQKPIVTTDVPGCRSVVADGVNGYLVPPGDAAALAKALSTLIEDHDLRQRMGQKGREIVLDRFAHETVNRAFLDIYRNFSR